MHIILNFINISHFNYLIPLLLINSFVNVEFFNINYLLFFVIFIRIILYLQAYFLPITYLYHLLPQYHCYYLFILVCLLRMVKILIIAIHLFNKDRIVIHYFLKAMCNFYINLSQIFVFITFHIQNIYQIFQNS